jgi:hypothetical protein
MEYKKQMNPFAQDFDAGNDGKKLLDCKKPQ